MMSIRFQIFSVVFILLITGFSSIPAELDLKKSSWEDDIDELVQHPCRKLEVLPVDKYPAVSQIGRHETMKDGDNETGILPKDSYPIQQYPTLATLGNRLLVLAETNTNLSAPGKITATSSETNGSTWDYHMTLSHDQTSFTTPSLDYTGDPEMQAYGSCMIDKQTGVQMIFCFPSLTDPLASYTGSSTDFDRAGWFSGRLLNWDPEYWTSVQGTATAGFPHGTIISPYEDFHGLSIWGGHDGTGWSYYFYCDTDQYTENDFKILWKNYLDGPVRQVDIDIDLTTGWSYDLAEIINQTTGIHEIHMDMLYLEPGNQEWFNNDQNYGPNWVFRGYRQPSIKATNGRVHLTAVKDNDIYIHISRNKGYTYETIQLTNTSQHEHAPEVTAVNDYIIVTFVKNHDLYSIVSQDAGINWGEPKKLNQKLGVISEQSNHVCVENEYCLWTETQENTTISLVKQTIKTPQFIIENITGGTNVSFEVINIGTADAVAVPYSIRIDGGWIFTNRYINGTINLQQDEKTMISTPAPIFGFGSPRIIMTIGSTQKTVQAKLFLWYLLID